MYGFLFLFWTFSSIFSQFSHQKHTFFPLCSQISTHSLIITLPFYWKIDNQENIYIIDRIIQHQFQAVPYIIDIYNFETDMENNDLKKRLYQNLSQRSLKHTFLLQSEVRDPKSPQGVLKPKILQTNMGELKSAPNNFAISPKHLKLGDNSDKKQMPKKVQIQKLSKQAKSIVEDGKNKIRSNLKPAQIFSFYDAFPEMIEDFFYLNRMSHPYDYQIVSYAKRNSKQYMTISSQGVTLYHDKEAQFLTRQEWLQDEKIYYQLQKIDFFSQYKLSKNFIIWKYKMKDHYIKSMSNVLREKLFLASLHPRKCLIQICDYCTNMEDNLTLLPTEHIESLNEKDLIHTINHHLSNSLMIKINQSETLILQSLERAIDEQIRNFKESNKIKIDGLNSQEENKEGYIYSQEAILRKQYKRVLKLIKLAECMLLQSKIKLIQRWMTQILQRLEDIKETSFRDQWLTINFIAMPPQQNSMDIIWNPCYESFVNILKMIVDRAIVEISCKHQRIMNNPIFEKYRSSQDQALCKDQKNKCLKNLIQQSSFYKEMSEKIRLKLQEQFKQVAMQESELKKYIQIYKKHKNMPPLQTLIKQSTVAQLSIFVHQWKEDNAQMKDLPDKCIGMIKFDYSLIRKQMMNVAENSCAKLFSLLPAHLGQMVSNLHNKTTELNTPLEIIFETSKFVEFTKAVKRASDELEGISDQSFEIKRLEILLAENKGSSLEAHKHSLRSLFKGIESLVEKVKDAEIKQSQRLTQFKKDNENLIKKIKLSVKEYSIKLQQIEGDQKVLSQDSILDKLAGIQTTIADLDKQATNINITEYELSLPETDLSQAHNLHLRVEVLSSLWNQKKLWKQFNSELLSKFYEDIDCEKQMASWSRFNEQISKIKHHLDQNQFMNQIVREIQETFNEIQLVRALQSKSLNQKSWVQISQYLSFEFDRRNIQSENNNSKLEPFKDPKNRMYTVEWLRTNKVSDYKQRIEQIVKKSEKQTQLISVIGIMKSYILSLNLKTVVKKREVTLLGDNSIVFQELNQHLVVLVDIFNHQYSQSLKKQTKSLVKHYEYVIQILQAYKQFGLNWEKYEELFDSSKHYSKQLSKQAKDFSNLETAWKKIIKSIVLQNWSKRVYDETTGPNPNRNTMKAVQKANSIWQQIKKGVEQFLDKRRSLFHHYFYFSDEELIGLMTKPDSNFNINSVVPIIYQNIKGVNTDSNGETFLSVVSAEGEELKINKAITIKMGSEFEQMLKFFQQQWKKSLIHGIKKVFSDFINANEDEVSRNKVILQNVTQTVLAFDNLLWVKLGEETYLCPEPVGSLHDWIMIQNGQIAELKVLKQNSSLEIEHKKLESLILQSIYLREKTECFLKNQIVSSKSYEWTRTLKLYDSTGNIFLRASGSSIPYGGQFFGSSSLFIAPQTQHSFLNIMQLVNDRQIGVLGFDSHNVETIRHFTRFIGQNFRVFNFCSGVSRKMIDRIFTGVCSQGVWSCMTPPDEWQTVSVIASHISTIEKCIRQNIFATQIYKLPISINQSNLPTFFLRLPNSGIQNLQKVHRLNYRHFSMISPSTKTILAMHLNETQRGDQIAQIVSEVTNYCKQLFQDKFYDQFGVGFALSIVHDLKINNDQSIENIRKKVCHVLNKKLSYRLKNQDQLVLQALIQTLKFENDQKLKSKKIGTISYPVSAKSITISNQNFQDFDQIYIKNANSILDSINSSWQTCRNVIIVGPALCGKGLLIDQVKKHIEQVEKCKINLSKVYFMAHKDTELFCTGQKGPGIITKCLKQNEENWIVLDGPLNDKYLNLFGKASSQLILSNYGVIKSNNISRNLKFILKTANLGRLSPDFVYFNKVVHIQQDQKCIQNIIRTRLTNFVYNDHEQETRVEVKGDDNTQLQLKSLKAKPKSIRLSKQLFQVLIGQMISLVEKLAPKGSLKLKTIQFLYELSKAELAYKCCKLVQSIFIQNWDTINEKINKKVIQKFVCWAVLWTLSTVVVPDDLEKLEKTVSQMTKSTLFDGILKSIVFPGSGFDIYSLSSTRVQNALSSIPNCGQISNIVNKYNSLFDSQSSLSKNKFENQFHFDEPHRIRVITQQSALYAYFALLNRHVNIPIVLYGPQGSGKKCTIDIFNKKNKQNVDTYSIRFKKYDPYFISKQIQKPFNKLQKTTKFVYRPFDISKRIHISIDDVSMTPYHEPSTEFLRMIANQNGLYDEKYNQVQFRQLMLTLTVNQIKFNNFQGVDFTRVLSRLFLLQTSRKSKEKLSAIFTPIIENLWFEFLFNDSSQKAQSFINKNRENIIINSTVSMYSFMEQLAEQSPCNNIIELNKKLLLTPKIQEISSIIGNLCQVEDNDSNDMSYYAQFWAFQVMRVFGDKIVVPQQHEAFFDEIKRSCFIEFKHNLTNSTKTTIFSNICVNQEDERDGNKSPFIKYQSTSDLQRQMEEIYCKQTGSECLPLIAEQFTSDLVKIYRVLKMAGGNLLISTPLKKCSKILTKIANILTKGDIYHDIENGRFDFDIHLSPSILKDINCTIIFDIESASQQLIYLMTCIVNRNVYDFDMSGEVREKIRAKFIAIAQQSWNKEQSNNQQNQLGKTNGKNRSFSISQNQDNLRLLEIQNRIQFDFLQIITDCITDYIHIITFVQPHRMETTKIISQNMSLIKHMQICWFDQYKEQTLVRTSERMMQISKGSIECKKQFIDKCAKVYELLNNEQKSQAHFSKFCESCYRTYENLSMRIDSQIGLYQDCLAVINKNSQKAEVRRQQSKKLQQKMEQVARNQEQLNLNIKKCQEQAAENIQNLELEMKKIKSDKESLDLQCRQARNCEKLSQSFTNLLPNKQNLQNKLKKVQETNKLNQQYSILVQSAILFLNNATKDEYLEQFGKWAQIVGIGSITDIKSVVTIFENVNGIQVMRVPGWHKFSSFTQLKGFHFFQNFKNMPESVFGMQPIVVEDKQQTLVRMLSSILSYYNTKLITHVSSKKLSSNKKQESQRAIRKEMMSNLQKQLIKAIGEQKEDCRNQDKLELRNGVILVGENYKWQPTRNDIEILEKKVLKQRRYIINNHVIIRGSTSPNISFYADNEDLKYLLMQKSIQIQYGQSKVSESNRVQTLIRQIAIIEEEKRNCLIQKSIEKETEQIIIQNMQAIENQLMEIEKNKKKMHNYINDNQKIVNDIFLIDWLLGFADDSPAWSYQRVIEIYEFLKRCLMELNYSRDEKIDNIEKVEPNILKNWENLVKANLNKCEEMSLSQYVSLCMPLSETINLILLPGEGMIQQHLSKLLENCPYNIQYLNMHMSFLGSYLDSQNQNQQQENRKNLHIFSKMTASNSQITCLVDYLEKNKNTSCPVAIIVTNQFSELAENPILCENYRIIKKSIPLAKFRLLDQISSIDDQKDKKNCTVEAFKALKKVNAEEDDIQASHTHFPPLDTLQQDPFKIKQGFKKFFTLYFGTNISQGNPLRNNNMPLKAIMSRIKLIKNCEQARVLLKDFAHKLTEFWQNLLTQIFSVPKKGEQGKDIESLQIAYANTFEEKDKQVIEYKEKEKKRQILAWPNSQQIQEIITLLPFSFNCQDFKQSNEPIVIWLVEQANNLNNKKFLLKKYLQQCGKIVKGNKLNYWENTTNFGFWIPKEEQIMKLSADFKIIKKALELLGIAGGIQSSSKEIRLLNNSSMPGQGQSILSLACQSIDWRDYDNFSRKIMLLLMIKAAKKLKLSISKLKINWRIITTDAIIEEPISGQNCLTLNATLSEPINFDYPKPLNTKQATKTKILMMIYDPSPVTQATQQISKQGKKQKPKKKQQQIKLVAENQVNMIGIGIKLKNGDQVGSIKIAVKQNDNSLNVLIKQPFLGLF